MHTHVLFFFRVINELRRNVVYFRHLYICDCFVNFSLKQMADEDSPIIEDILFNTGANYFEDNEDGSTNDESKFCFY